MKTYKDSQYSYVKIVEIDRSEIDKADLAICKQPRETLGNFYARQTVKPDVLFNAGFFSMKDGSTIFNVVDEWKTISTDPNLKWGMGVCSDGKTIKFGSVADKTMGFKDFVSAYPVLIDAGSRAPITYAKELNYKATRTMLGYNEEKIFVVFVGKPGLAYTAMTNVMLRLKCTYAINLDGGGSSRGLVNGKVFNSPTENRAVDSVFAIYLKKPSTSTKTKSTSKTDTKPSTLSAAYYIYTVKRGDSWWGIAAKELGSGAKYVKLRTYNNCSPSKVLHPNEKIKIPYSLK